MEKAGHILQRTKDYFYQDTFDFQTPDTYFKWKSHNGQIQENKDKKISLPSKYEPTLIMGILDDPVTQVKMEIIHYIQYKT